ncbi:hypothetical protein WJ971_00600 [Achromobacter xylosoxidans]
MSGINANGGIGGVSLQNLQSMDVETALMAVQQERTRLLDTQLQSQIQEVQNRNDMIAKLNTVLSALNSAAAQFKSGASATDTIPDWNNDKVKAIEIPLNDAIKAAGLGDLGFTARQGRISNPRIRWARCCRRPPTSCRAGPRRAKSTAPSTRSRA